MFHQNACLFQRREKDKTALEECFTIQKLPQQLLLNSYSEENVCSVYDPNDSVVKFDEDQTKLSIFVKHSPFFFFFFKFPIPRWLPNC